MFHCFFIPLCRSSSLIVLLLFSCSVMLTLCDPVDCNLPGTSSQWDFSGKNNGVSCHFLLQGIFPTQGLNLHLLHCRWILYCWATQEALIIVLFEKKFLKWSLSLLDLRVFWSIKKVSISKKVEKLPFSVCVKKLNHLEKNNPNKWINDYLFLYWSVVISIDTSS